MIIELKEKDLPALLSLLRKDKYRNLFFINNILTLTLGKEYRIYKVNEAYLMNFMNSSMLIYSENSYDEKKVFSFLQTQKFKGINGGEESLAPLEGYMKELGITHIDYRNMMMVTKDTFKRVTPRDSSLRSLFGPEDFEDLFDLYLRCPEYKDDFIKEDKEEFGLDMAEKEYPFAAAGLYVRNKMVSGGYLSAYTKESAMVVGVATDPDYRNGGLATKTVSELVDIAINENNIGYLCLWYSTPEAERIYKKLGFEPIGKYAYFHK